jgi:hypothetical protein
MMKRLLRSYVYNGFVWELNCSTSGELNDDKSSGRAVCPTTPGINYPLSGTLQ